MEALLGIFATPGFGEMALVAAMIFIVVLLLGLLIWSRWHWGVKSTVTVMAGLFFVLTYFSIIEMQGWPTKSQMPEKFYLVGYYVDPPNKQINKEGFIVVWVLEFKSKIGRKPRAYIIDYSLRMHKKLQEARKKGSRMVGERIKKKDKKKGGKPGSEFTPGFKFYNLPPPELPRKQ